LHGANCTTPNAAYVTLLQVRPCDFVCYLCGLLFGVFCILGRCLHIPEAQAMMSMVELTAISWIVLSGSSKQQQHTQYQHRSC
jgi:hypothetical protein